MTREAPRVAIRAEHLGMPFDRNADGTNLPTSIWWHGSKLCVKNQFHVHIQAADRTGHALLHTLYQSNVKMGTQFFVESIALDLIRNEAGDVLRVTAIDQETGKIAVFQGKATLFATGGAGRVYRASTNAYINTGDGLGMAARTGIPLQDMNYQQFHPTGVAGAGVLLTKVVVVKVQSFVTMLVSRSSNVMLRRLKTWHLVTWYHVLSTKKLKKVVAVVLRKTTSCLI